MKVETTTADGKRCFEPRPVRHGPTQDGFHGISHSVVKLHGCKTDVAGGQVRSMKETLGRVRHECRRVDSS